MVRNYNPKGSGNPDYLLTGLLFHNKLQTISSKELSHRWSSFPDRVAHTKYIIAYWSSGEKYIKRHKNTLPAGCKSTLKIFVQFDT